MSAISAYHQTANAFFAAIDSNDRSRLSDLLSEQFKYYRHPGLAALSGNKSSYLEAMSVFDLFDGWNPNINNPISVVENEKERQIVILMSATPRLKTGKTYTPEYVWFFHFDEDGKIDMLREVADTVYGRTVRADVQEYQASIGSVA